MAKSNIQKIKEAIERLQERGCSGDGKTFKCKHSKSSLCASWSSDICPAHEAIAALELALADALHEDVVALTEQDLWSEHSIFQRIDWQEEVGSGNTQLGYWNWVSNKIKEREDERNAVMCG